MTLFLWSVVGLCVANVVRHLFLTYHHSSRR